MTAKEKVRQILDRLPDDCSLEEVLYHVHVANAVAAGRREMEEGQVLSHEEVEAELRRRWVPAGDESPGRGRPALRSTRRRRT